MTNKLAIAFCLLIISQQSIMSQELVPGSPAPAIAVSRWIKGEPIDQFKRGRYYIVEFWATWCGPCRTVIPHLSELARKYTDQLSVIGISISEQNPEAVAPYVKQLGEQMDYSVAIDSQANGDPATGMMQNSWMKNAGLNNIPAAFVVDTFGIIQFIGYPDLLDSVLDELINKGSWDVAAYSEIWREEQQNNKLAEDRLKARLQIKDSLWNKNPIKLLSDRIRGLINDKEYSKALKATDTLEKMPDTDPSHFPDPAMRALEFRCHIYYAQENKRKYLQALDQSLDIIAADSVMGGYSVIGGVIWVQLVDPDSRYIKNNLRDYHFSKQWMQRVLRHPAAISAANLHTMALIERCLGNERKAARYHQRSLRLLQPAEELYTQFEKQYANVNYKSKMKTD